MAARSRAPKIRQNQWNDIHATFRSLYIDQEKPLREVISILEKTMGFKATLKQYKTYINRSGLSKYNKAGSSRLPQHACSRMSQEVCACMPSDACICVATAVDPTSSNLLSQTQDGHQNYSPGVDKQFEDSVNIHVERLSNTPGSYLQSMFPCWDGSASQSFQKAPVSDIFRDPVRPTLVSSSTIARPVNTISADVLFSILETRWRKGQVDATDILEIRNLATFFTAARSHEDAYRLGYETLFQSIAADNQSTEHISQTILDATHNCKHVYGAKKVSNLLSLTTFWSPKPEERSLASWCLLRSFVGSLLFDLGDFQSALDICHSMMTKATSLWSENILSWQYRWLAMNLSKVCKAREKDFDDVDAWRQYLDEKHTLRTTLVDESVSIVLRWCFTVLELQLFWTVFQDSDESPWTTASKVTNADLAEFESRVLFCFFWKAWKNPALIAGSDLSWNASTSLWSVCNICDMLPDQLFATISYMIAHSQCEQEDRKYKSNLPRRARNRIEHIHNIPTPTKIFENACWPGSSFTVALLETRAHMQFKPYKFSQDWYRKLVDSFVREFANENYKIVLSQAALKSMTEPLLGLPDLAASTNLPSQTSSRCESGDSVLFAKKEVSNIDFDDLQVRAFLQAEQHFERPLFEILTDEKVS